MKDINLLVWLSQLGISVALPLAGFVLLGVWLHNQFQWGIWVIFVGIALGLIGAIQGLRSSLKMMEQMTKDKKEQIPPVSFNEHE
jgi:hypothetical protein